MVVVSCPVCHKRRLLGLESITGLDNTGIGVTLEYRCSCGGMGSMLVSNGRRARER